MLDSFRHSFPAMHTAAIKRLLWKDARTLLPIWGALLAVVVAIQLVIVLDAALYSGPRPTDSDVFSWKTLFTVASPLAFCFAAAAAGILFAGESEEGTDDWLRLLPVSPRVLAASKIGIGLAALVAFVMLAMATALAATAIGSRQQLIGMKSIEFMAICGLVFMGGMLALLTGVFLSVRMRRVTSVVVGSLVMTLPLVGFSGWFANDVLGLRSGYELLFVFAALGLLDVWLVLRWCRGESVALPRPTAWIDAAGERLSIGRSFSLTRLQRLATAGHPSRRAFGVQVWRELRSAIPFALIWGASGLFFLAPHGVKHSSYSLWEVLQVLSMVYWVLTPGLSGLLASAGDQRSRQQMFLGQRGVPAMATWLAKQLTWLTVAVLLTTAWGWLQFTLTAGSAGQVGDHRNGNTCVVALTRSIHTPRLSNQDFVTPEDIVLRRQYLLSMLLSLYAVGQLCGFWFRNVFVAGAVMLFMHLPVGLWHLAVVAMDVPLWMGTGPLIALWLLATWRLMDSWLTGRFAHGLRRRRLAWLVGPCLAALVMYTISRRTQIPEVEFPAHLVSSIAATRLPPQEIGDTGGFDWEDWTQSLQRYTEASERSAGPDGALPPEGAALSDPQESDAQLIQLAADLRSLKLLNLPISHWTASTTYQSVADYVALRRVDLQDSMHIDHVLDLHLNGLFILEGAARQYPGAMQPALAARQTIIASLSTWVQDARRAENQLQQLADDQRFIRECSVDYWCTPEQLAHAHAETVRQLKSKQGPDYLGLIDRAEIYSPYGLWPWTLVRVWSAINGDHHRTVRFLDVVTCNATSIAHWDRTAGAESELEISTRSNIERWDATTCPYELALPSAYLGDPIRRLQDDVLAMQVDLASRRGLWLLLALERHRRETGSYPQTLHELAPHAQLPRDPFTGADFRYLPQGLDATWLLGNEPYRQARFDLQTIERHQGSQAAEAAHARMFRGSEDQFVVIPARQPILFSAGPFRGTYTYQPAAGHMVFTDPERTAAEQAGGVPDGVYRENVSGAINDGGPWRLPIATVRAPHDARPAFVVLGLEFLPWGVQPVKSPSDKLPQRR